MTPYLAGAGWTVGHTPTSNGDACDLRRSTTPGGRHLVASVADGASSTLFAGLWASHLVALAVDGWIELSDEEIYDEVEAARRTYAPPVDTADRFVARKWKSLGSQATLVVAAMDAQGADVRLRALAVGDSEVIVVRRQECLFFPVRSSDEFDSTPMLITSREGDEVELRRWSCRLSPGDLVLLASDAVAQRLLEIHEIGGRSMLVAAIGRLVVEGHELEAALSLEGRRPLDDDLTVIVCGVADEPAHDLEVLAGLLGRPSGTAFVPSPPSPPHPSRLDRITSWVRRD